jgi:hypothetical protein
MQHVYDTQRDRAATVEGAVELTFLITFPAYGNRLHGGESGSVDPEHNVPGTPALEVDPAREAAEQECMNQAPYKLDQSVATQ